MTYDQIITDEPSRALINEFVRRWGVRGGIQRAAIKLGTTQAQIQQSRRFF